jgi:hypothetical protein
MPIIRHGQGGSRTDVVCGFLHSDDVLFDPALRALPPVFVVRPPEGPAARWVEANISFALEQAGERGWPSTRLPELLLVEILRLHLSTAPAADRGWLAALRDPVLALALARLHAEPARRWSISELAGPQRRRSGTTATPTPSPTTPQRSRSGSIRRRIDHHLAASWGSVDAPITATAIPTILRSHRHMGTVPSNAF